MTVKETINKSVLAYAKNPLVGYAIHLDGNWGHGKSHYVNTCLKPYLISNDFDCIIVSLFGLSTRSEIENEIIGFLSTMDDSFLFDLVKKSVSALTIKGEEFNTSGGLVSSSVSALFNTLKRRKLNNTLDKEALFIFDDFERFEGDISIPMSFVSRLIEQASAKVMIICNEEQFNLDCKDGLDNKFLKFKEKVIGRSLKFHLTNSEISEGLISIVERDQKMKALFEQMADRANFYPAHPLTNFKNFRNIQKAAFLLIDFVQISGNKLITTPLLSLSIFHCALKAISENDPNHTGDLHTTSHEPGHLITNDIRECINAWLSIGYLSESQEFQLTSYMLSSSFERLLDEGYSITLVDRDIGKWNELFKVFLKELDVGEYFSLEALYTFIGVLHDICRVWPCGYVERCTKYLDAFKKYLNNSNIEASEKRTAWNDFAINKSSENDCFDLFYLYAHLKPSEKKDYEETILPKIYELDGRRL